MPCNLYFKVLLKHPAPVFFCDVTQTPDPCHFLFGVLTSTIIHSAQCSWQVNASRILAVKSHCARSKRFFLFLFQSNFSLSQFSLCVFTVWLKSEMLQPSKEICFCQKGYLRSFFFRAVFKKHMSYFNHRKWHIKYPKMQNKWKSKWEEQWLWIVHYQKISPSCNFHFLFEFWKTQK